MPAVLRTTRMAICGSVAALVITVVCAAAAAKSTVAPAAVAMGTIASLTEEPAAAESWWSVGVPILVVVLGELLAAVFVVRVLSQGGSPSTTIAWVLLILSAPYVGLALYYLLPRRLLLRRLAKRADQMAWIEPQLQTVLPSTPPAGPRTEPLERLLCRLDHDAVVDGNQLELLPTGADFVTRSLAALDQARSFVHLEAYIFRPDGTGTALIERLTEVARRGIEVRLLYDSIGSWSLRRRHLRGLLAAGGKAEAYAPLLWRRRPFTLNLRNHRKLLVVDGELAILGGRNIGDEYASDHFADSGRWLDSMIAVEGPAVPRLHRVFVEDWFHASDEDLAKPRYFPEQQRVGDERVGIVASGPDAPNNNFSWTLFQLLGAAETSIDISSPYVVPDVPTLTALQVAAARGVRVRILTNSAVVAQPILHRAQRSHYGALLSVGVEIYESGNDYNHAKMVIVDDARLLVGSPNLDVRSEQLNFELAIVTESATACEAAAALFRQRLRPAHRIDPTAAPATRPWDPLLNGICRVLSPVL